MVKKGIFRSVLMLLVAAIMASCGDYGKILKSKDNDVKYKAARDFYANKKYDKALPLFEDVLAAWKGQDKSEEVYYYYCYTQYAMGNLPAASFHFKNYSETFFTSKKLQECAFMHAHCEYDMALPTQLDQSQTTKAIDELQLFINLHPTSIYVDSCNTLMDELRKQLVKKDFNIAMLYYNTEHYNSAVTAFENLLKDYPDVEDADNVQFLIIRSYQKMAENSVPSKVLERWVKTQSLCAMYIAKYSNTNRNANKVISIKETADKKITLLKKQ